MSCRIKPKSNVATITAGATLGLRKGLKSALIWTLELPGMDGCCCHRARSSSPKADKPNICLRSALAQSSFHIRGLHVHLQSFCSLRAQGLMVSVQGFCGKIHLLDARAHGCSTESTQGQLWHQPPPSPGSFGCGGAAPSPPQHPQDSPFDLPLLPPPLPPLPLQIRTQKIF